MLPILAALSFGLVRQAPVTVDLEVVNTVFRPAKLVVPPGASIRIRNRDSATYTLEGPGVLAGDVMLEPKSEQILIPTGDAGSYQAVLEEHPSHSVSIILQGPPRTPRDPNLTPFAIAREQYRQPLVSAPGQDPAYASFSAFDIAIHRESTRQTVLQRLYLLAEELSGESPPAELAPFFTATSWAKARTSISLVIGLGPSSYSVKRFGSNVARTRPAGLKEPSFGSKKISLAGQRDILIRAASDSDWLNQRICRLAWRRLTGLISRQTLASGYANPSGRSPILGGFFDGTGNPSGTLRERTVYGSGRNDSTLAFFKIRFDEERFLAKSLAAQQATIGREKASGKQLLKPPATNHRGMMKQSGMDILRMPVVYDEGPGQTGLLFVSAQASLFRQLENPLKKVFGSKTMDQLMTYMHFEEAAYYYIPPSNHGSYPGSLRDRP